MIQIIVEGDGDVAAAPILLRRLLFEMEIFELQVDNNPVRRPRNQLIQEFGVRNAIRLAKSRENTKAILVAFDLDDDCARDIIPNVMAWAASEASPLPCAVALPRREFEAWFIAALESLRGQRGIAKNAEYSGNPELKRDAKGVIRGFMGRVYNEPSDQPALTAVMDLKQAYQNASPSANSSRNSAASSLNSAIPPQFPMIG